MSLLAPGKTDYTACHPRKTSTCILQVVPITTHPHDRRKSIGKKKQRKEKKLKERKDKKAKNENGKDKKAKNENGKDKKSKKRQDKKRKQGKENNTAPRV